MDVNPPTDRAFPSGALSWAKGLETSRIWTVCLYVPSLAPKAQCRRLQTSRRRHAGERSAAHIWGKPQVCIIGVGSWSSYLWETGLKTADTAHIQHATTGHGWLRSTSYAILDDT